MSSLSGDRDQELRLHLRDERRRVVVVLRHEAAAVKRRGRADARRHRGRRAHDDRAAHAVARVPIFLRLSTAAC